MAFGLLFGLFDPLDRNISNYFGESQRLLIALEFNHTFHYVVVKEQSIVQTKVMLLIALLALAHKFIILDVNEMTPRHLLGLAAITLGLGVMYRLMRERDDRIPLTRKRTARPEASELPKCRTP